MSSRPQVGDRVRFKNGDVGTVIATFYDNMNGLYPGKGMHVEIDNRGAHWAAADEVDKVAPETK